MATTTSLRTNVIEALLPRYGENRVNLPIWNESQRMFITQQYTSAAGHHYYSGVRFSDRFVIIMHIGKWNTWTYLNEVDVYTFDGKDHTLIGSANIDTFYQEALVRQHTENILRDYLVSSLNMQGTKVALEDLNPMVTKLVDSSYKSLLDTPNLSERLEAVQPLLAEKINQKRIN
jgi:hypothetical protein